MTDMTDAELAKLCGWREKVEHLDYAGERSITWIAPDASRHRHRPSYSTDIRASMAEIERLGWTWGRCQDNDDGFVMWVQRVGAYAEGKVAPTDGTLTGDTLALRAALAAAAKAKEASDGR